MIVVSGMHLTFLTTILRVVLAICLRPFLVVRVLPPIWHARCDVTGSFLVFLYWFYFRLVSLGRFL